MDNACFVVLLFVGMVACALAMPAGLIVQENLPETAVDMTTTLPENQDQSIQEHGELQFHKYFIFFKYFFID